MKTDEGIKKINGIDIYYKVIGRGEPVVILHGGPGLGHNYLLPHFNRLSHHYQLIFYDQRSSGKSSGHETPLEITIENFIKDLELLRITFGLKRMNLAGQSWGGLLSLHYAVTYPDHVKTLMLLETSGASSAYIKPFNDAIENRLTENTKIQLAGLAKSIKKNRSVSELYIDYQYKMFSAYFYNRAFLKELHLDYMDDEMVRKNLIVNNRLSGYFSSYDMFDKIKKITCPTLIIHGDYDPIPFQEIKRIHEHIKGSQFILLEKSGHFSYIEKKDQYFKAIEEFLHHHSSDDGAEN